MMYAEPEEDVIFRIASRLSPCAEAVREWYVADSIERLGGWTAHELVRDGRGAEVIGLLLDALSVDKR